MATDVLTTEVINEAGKQSLILSVEELKNGNDTICKLACNGHGSFETEPIEICGSDGRTYYVAMQCHTVVWR